MFDEGEAMRELAAAVLERAVDDLAIRDHRANARRFLLHEYEQSIRSDMISIPSGLIEAAIRKRTASTVSPR